MATTSIRANALRRRYQVAGITVYEALVPLRCGFRCRREIAAGELLTRAVVTRPADSVHLEPGEQWRDVRNCLVYAPTCSTCLAVPAP